MGMRRQKQKTIRDRAHDFAEQVKPSVEHAVVTARETAHDVAEAAREQGGPLLEQGRAVAGERASAAAAKASVAGSAAGVAAGKAAAKAREAASEKTASLRPEPKKKKRGKLKKMVLLGGLAAIGGVVFKKLKGDDSDNWQSSYVPTPPPAGAPGTDASPSAAPNAGGTAGATGAGTVGGAHSAGTDSAGDDPAGADPAEALADSTDEPHRASTPDAPAEVTELMDKPKD